MNTIIGGSIVLFGTVFKIKSEMWCQSSGEFGNFCDDWFWSSDPVGPLDGWLHVGSKKPTKNYKGQNQGSCLPDLYHILWRVKGFYSKVTTLDHKNQSLEERPPPRVNVVSFFLLANLSKLFEKGIVIPNLKEIGQILRPLERIYLYIILVGEDNY